MDHVKRSFQMPTNHFFAIEVKNSKKIRPADLRPLKTFNEDYPESRPIIIYRGTEKLLRNNILMIPCEEFLLNINEILN